TADVPKGSIGKDDDAVTEFRSARPPPEEICWDSRGNEGDPDQGIAGIRDDGAKDDEAGCSDEHDRKNRKTDHAEIGAGFPSLLLSSPIDEERCHDESEKDPVAEYDIIQELTERAAERQHDRPRTLKKEWPVRGLVFRMEPSESLQEEVVVRHRLVDTRRGEDVEIQDPEDRHDDTRAYQHRPRWSCDALHGLGRRSDAAGQAVDTERVEVGEIHDQIRGHDDSHAHNQRPGQIPRGVLELSRNVIGMLPSSIREEHGDQCRAHGSNDRPHRWRVTQKAPSAGRNVTAPQSNRGYRHPRKSEHLQHRKDVLGDGSQPHADIVDPRQEHNGANGNGGDQRGGPSKEINSVLREYDSQCRYGSGRAHEQQLPAVKKSKNGAEGLAQIDVSSARLRTPRTQLGETDRPDQGQYPPKRPCQ